MSLWVSPNLEPQADVQVRYQAWGISLEPSWKNMVEHLHPKVLLSHHISNEKMSFIFHLWSSIKTKSCDPKYLGKLVHITDGTMDEVKGKRYSIIPERSQFIWPT